MPMQIAVVGLGYVGLPLAIELASLPDVVVSGIDTDAQRVYEIGQGVTGTPDVTPLEVVRAIDAGRFAAYSSYAPIVSADAIIICVPTPLNKLGSPDLTYVASAIESILPHLKHHGLIVLESTVYPGATREIVLGGIEESYPDWIAGEDFYVAFSPERIDPGSGYALVALPKVIGGATTECFNVAAAMYGQLFDVVHVDSLEAAEMTKLFENTFRAVNIGLVNELAMMCDVLDIDVDEVVAAAGTKPYGFMSFTPGPGIGGHCIPIDPSYLAWRLRTLHYKARFIELAVEVNASMPEWWVGKLQNALNDRAKKALSKAKVLVVGVAYKRNVGDMRESPAIEIVRLLAARGANIQYEDPYVDEFYVDDILYRRDPAGIDIKLGWADAVMIVTDHDCFDWGLIIEATERKIVIDTRGALTRHNEGVRNE